MNLPPPGPSQAAYFDVSALEAGKLTVPEALLYVNDPDPDIFHTRPSLSFLLRHHPSGKLIVFDLGVRKDFENCPPAVVELIKQGQVFTVAVDQDVKESLIKGGVDPANVGHVILSHLHWDHVGDISLFPNATIVLGDEGRPLLSPNDPTASHFDASAAPEGRTHWVSSKDWTPIGPFPLAHDFFGDGSLYLIDAAGHLPGHLNLLVRNSGTGSWILLAADSMHDARVLTGEKHVAPNLQFGCAHVEPEKADAHLQRVKSLLKIPGVQVVMAHHNGWESEHPDEHLPGKIKPTA